MKKITAIVCLLLSCSFIRADNLFDENRSLKEKLKNQEKELQPLHQQNENLKIKVKALLTTNDLLSGKLKYPPKDIPGKNKTVWDYKLDSLSEYWGNNSYPEYAKNIQDGSENVLRIVGDEKKKNCLVKFFSREELEKIKGKTLACSIMAKGKDIGGKGKVKFMLMVQFPEKKTMWPGAQIGKGAFDWTPVSFKCNVPLDAKSVAMIIGIQNASGTVWYKNMKVSMIIKQQNK